MFHEFTMKNGTKYGPKSIQFIELFGNNNNGNYTARIHSKHVPNCAYRYLRIIISNLYTICFDCFTPQLFQNSQLIDYVQWKFKPSWWTAPAVIVHFSLLQSFSEMTHAEMGLLFPNGSCSMRWHSIHTLSHPKFWLRMHGYVYVIISFAV